MTLDARVILAAAAQFYRDYIKIRVIVRAPGILLDANAEHSRTVGLHSAGSCASFDHHVEVAPVAAGAVYFATGGAWPSPISSPLARTCPFIAPTRPS